jgi:hypothetical protein
MEFLMTASSSTRILYVELMGRKNEIRIIRSRRMRLAGHIARKGEKRAAYRLLAGRSEGKRRIGIPRYRWVDNIEIISAEIGCGAVDWAGLTQDRDK